MAGSTVSRLVLIPGLGVDGSLFDAQRAGLGVIESPDWIDPEEGESLRGYAQRLAAGIERDDGMVLGGQSFGGMLALEAARVLRPRAVVLIASCRRGRAVPEPFWMLERFSRVLSDRMARRIVLAQTSAIVWRMGCADDEARRFLEERLAAASLRFIRWAVRAIGEWSFDGELAMPVHHIHGACDRLIPVKRVEATHVVPNAGHLLNMTHAEEVNTFLGRIRNGCAT